MLLDLHVPRALYRHRVLRALYRNRSGGCAGDDGRIIDVINDAVETLTEADRPRQGADEGRAIDGAGELLIAC